MSIAHFSISVCFGCVSVFVGVCTHVCLWFPVCVYKLVVYLVLQETCLTHYIPAIDERL